jgi:hypothetical protein
MTPMDVRNKALLRLTYDEVRGAVNEVIGEDVAMQLGVHDTLLAWPKEQSWPQGMMLVRTENFPCQGNLLVLLPAKYGLSEEMKHRLSSAVLERTRVGVPVVIGHWR